MIASAGYITDTPYVPGFFHHMAPIAMRYAAVLNKKAPVANSECFRYLELGCGLGRVFTTLAAANPAGEFVGVDINPDHTAFAANDIKAGGLANARILTCDFASLPADLGLFDFVALHGVLSWVSAEVREQILAIARRHLAPGGLLLVSYNTMPGWAHLQPIRGILRQYAQLREGDALQKVRDAMAYLILLRDKQAKYFTDNPAAAAFVQNLTNQDLHYVAHEFMHEHWSTYYFSDVVNLFASADLSYVGSLPASTNYWELCIKPEFHDLFRTSQSRLVSEAHKDICANTAFRWDVYGKSCAVVVTLADRLACADDLVYRATRQGIQFPHQVNLGAVISTVQGEPYESLTALLSRSDLRLSQMLEAPDLQGFDVAGVVHALDLGVALGLYEVVANPLLDAPAVLPDQPRVLHPFNAHVLAADAFGGRIVTLASPVTGNGYSISDLDAAIVHELATAGAAGVKDRVLSRFQASGRSMSKDGQVVTDQAVIASALEQAIGKVQSTLIPQLIRHGILAAV